MDLIIKSRRQALGQHFLVNPRITDKIIRCISPQRDETILEIGSGKGVLTVPLSEKAHRVIAVETDAGLVEKLKPLLPGNVDLINRDILDINFENLLSPQEIKVAGNLPYSISTRILFKILDNIEFFKECHFLLQKEVAERITASSGSKTYAPISICIQNRYVVRIQFIVSPGNFSPPPKVQSAFISMNKRKQPLSAVALSRNFRPFLYRCFQHRRKTLANNLKAMGISPDQTEGALRAAELPMSIRPEKVDLEHFVKLFQLLPLEPD